MAFKQNNMAKTIMARILAVCWQAQIISRPTTSGRCRPANPSDGPCGNRSVAKERVGDTVRIVSMWKRITSATGDWLLYVLLFSLGNGSMVTVQLKKKKPTVLELILIYYLLSSFSTAHSSASPATPLRIAEEVVCFPFLFYICFFLELFFLKNTVSTIDLDCHFYLIDREFV